MKLRSPYMIVLLALVLAAALTGGAWYWTSQSSPVSTVPRSGLLVPASASDILTRVKAMNRPVVLINFWASWCGPCKEEFPSLLEAKKKLADRGLGVILVSMDDPQNFDTAQSFLKQEHVHFESFYKGRNPLSLVTKIYPHWSGSIPTTVLMNSQLQILDAWEGDASLQEFMQRIERQLKGS